MGKIVYLGNFVKKKITGEDPYRQPMARFSPIFGLCGLISVNGAVKFIDV